MLYEADESGIDKTSIESIGNISNKIWRYIEFELETEI
tara:strand:+ start:520 stop:633 length:114 start_codon:yes stop_codon:yes gene_type:complete